jgi:deoxyribose-phosphate aldolase
LTPFKDVASITSLDPGAQDVAAGAQEVDVVLPYAALRAGDEASVLRLLQAVLQERLDGWVDLCGGRCHV